MERERGVSRPACQTTAGRRGHLEREPVQVKLILPTQSPPPPPQFNSRSQYPHWSSTSGDDELGRWQRTPTSTHSCSSGWNPRIARCSRRHLARRASVTEYTDAPVYPSFDYTVFAQIHTNPRPLASGHARQTRLLFSLAQTGERAGRAERGSNRPRALNARSLIGASRPCGSSEVLPSWRASEETWFGR